MPARVESIWKKLRGEETTAACPWRNTVSLNTVGPYKANRSSGQQQHLPRCFRHPLPASGVRDMALSSGGWAPPAPVPASSQHAACGGPAPTACCSTVLMSVRVSVCHSGIRPLCLPGAGSEALRLQLSMDPSRAGEFRLALRDTSGNRSVVSCHTYTWVFRRRVVVTRLKHLCCEPHLFFFYITCIFYTWIGPHTPFYVNPTHAAQQIEICG